MMDSAPISQFLESMSPDPSVPLTSALGSMIEDKARAVVGRTFYASVMPREIRVLSPRAQEYFRRTREASLGHRLEDLLVANKEEKVWSVANDNIIAVGELIETHKSEGPFVLGGRPSYTDFFVAGSLQFARVVDEAVFQRKITFPGYGKVYQACLPYMEKKD